jgi:hypothetical protein
MQAYSARFYDAYFTGLEGEVDFYIDEALDADGPILELGCARDACYCPLPERASKLQG